MLGSKGKRQIRDMAGGIVGYPATDSTVHPPNFGDTKGSGGAIYSNNNKAKPSASHCNSYDQASPPRLLAPRTRSGAPRQRAWGTHPHRRTSRTPGGSSPLPPDLARILAALLQLRQTGHPPARSVRRKMPARDFGWPIYLRSRTDAVAGRWAPRAPRWFSAQGGGRTRLLGRGVKLFCC